MLGTYWSFLRLSCTGHPECKVESAGVWSRGSTVGIRSDDRKPEVYWGISNLPARWTRCTETAPSPTPVATRLTLPDRTSPTAKTPGWSPYTSRHCVTGINEKGQSRAAYANSRTAPDRDYAQSLMVCLDRRWPQYPPPRPAPPT